MADHASSGFFVLRTPVLPFEEFLRVTQQWPDGNTPATDGSANASSSAAIRIWAERPEVKEALWIASPDLVHSLANSQEDPDSSKAQKLDRALDRYLARMTARATPFGAFAACSVGKISDQTNLELAPRSQYRRRTRLDMEYLVSLAESVVSDPEQRPQLTFRPNSTLHLAAGAYHHLLGRTQESGRVYQLVATEPTPFLQATLQRADQGATAQSLAAAIVASDPSITPEEAREFIGKLIDSQLLACDLVPPVMGQEALRHVAGRLEQGGQHHLAEKLRKLEGGLHALDRSGLGADISVYEEITATVAQLPGQFKPGRLVQVDTTKPAPSAMLDQTLVEEVRQAVELLHAMHGQAGQTVFSQFKEDFLERYQDREVPLLEALDDEAGIGFESMDNAGAEPMLEGVDFRRPMAQSTPDKSPGALLLRRLQETWSAKNSVLNLDDALLEELKSGFRLPLPDSFAAMGIVFRTAEGRHGFHLSSVIGPSGVNLAARFCHADDQLAACVRDHLHAEESLRADGAVFAEIAHLPEGRVGNVVWRPALRKYEIPFLATSAAPPEQQIALSDLTVSLVEDRIVLRSRRLQREVLPCLTTAHNFVGDRSLKLYKFLCLLQYQNVSTDLAWDWGSLAQAAFLPRVVLGDIVFSLARWRVMPEDVAQLGTTENAGRLARVDEWRTARQLPRFVYISEFDNQLLIDFQNGLSVDVFLEHISKNPETLLVEMFPAPEELAVHGPEGNFVHELILPFVRQPSLEKNDEAAAASANASVPVLQASSAHDAALLAAGPSRSFMPGSEWLYAKLYCSPSHADRLLRDLVQPLVREVMSAGTADGWFFIRFSDPRWHLRLRLHGNPAALGLHVLPRLGWLAAEQQRQGTLWRMQLDTYEREVERYGGARAMALAERIFQLDSELCLSLLGLLTGGNAGNYDAQLRWHLAFCGAHVIFSGLGMDLEQRRAETERLARFREQEYVVDKFYKEQMARKFREQRPRLTALLEGGTFAGQSALPPEAITALARFAADLEPLYRQFRELASAGKLTRPLHDIVESFVHMFLNRMFRGSALTQETMVYEFLSRMYAAQLAKKD